MSMQHTGYQGAKKGTGIFIFGSLRGHVIEQSGSLGGKKGKPDEAIQNIHACARIRRRKTRTEIGGAQHD